MSSFVAQYRGKCGECGQGIEVGDQCTFDAARRVIHVHCPPDLNEVDLARPVCPICHIVKPCYCD